MRVLPHIFIVLLLSARAGAQDGESPLTMNGYLNSMQSVIFEKLDNDWIIDNLFHNRLNFQLYPSGHFNASLQLRNRFIFGETVKSVPGYAETIGGSAGWADLSFNLSSGNSYVLNSTIDRLWLQYTVGSFVITAGRQRINWGQTYVWNINDIFNAYSYFDFDYPERPGSDALRLQIYPNYTSTIEFAVKIDSSGKFTTAGLYRFNIASYDIQFIAGILHEEDYLGGIGWSGNIGPVSFRGEGTYFHPVTDPADTSGMFMFSSGLDYTFPNSLFLQAEYLYSSEPLFSQDGLSDYLSGQLSVKQLAFTRHTLFTSVSYPVTPLLQASLAMMYFPGLKGAFAGPSLSLNALENVDIGLFMQYFNALVPDPSSPGNRRQEMTLGYLRLKWSF